MESESRKFHSHKDVDKTQNPLTAAFRLPLAHQTNINSYFVIRN